MNIDWDVDKYTRDFSFVPSYGEDVLKLIDLPKSSLVVDLGCGGGVLTNTLFQMGYQVLGIDSSEDMLLKARETYPSIKFQHSDALDFRLEKKADCIFSNAVFHWIDKDRQLLLLENIAHNLKENGILVCEFGGYGCAKAVHGALERAFSESGLEYKNSFYFPAIGEYAPLVESAGMRMEYAVLFDRPTPLKSGGVSDWIRMFIKAPFEGVEAKLTEKIISRAAELTEPVLYKDGDWFVDYVRIRIKARKI
ncbi:MAG: class I SAM-dependent methyltransferase [Ruminococcus sp.]|nr:class I SAM-dependent methyltransferase [Ruminococcus sp.]